MIGTDLFPRLPGLATIKIDVDRKVGSVDRRIFGNFIEHIGRCVYGGVFDEGSALCDERGFRRDVLKAARRWRGGAARSTTSSPHGR